MTAALPLLVVAVGPVAECCSQQVDIAPPSENFSITVSADRASHWIEGVYDVWHLTGNVNLKQGATNATSREAILWVETIRTSDSKDTKKIMVYFENEFVMNFGEQTKNSIRDQVWFGRFFTNQTLQMNVIPGSVGATKPAIYQRANQYHQRESSGNVRLVQHLDNTQGPTLISPQTGAIIPSSSPTVQQGTGQPPALQNVPRNQPQQNGFGIVNNGFSGPIPETRVEWGPRTGVGGLNVRSVPSANPNETITVGTGGVRVVIDSDQLNRSPQLQGEQNKQITIVADSFVAWKNDVSGTDRWELYLEGDVVFTLGQRVIRAKRMYYDPNFKRGTILDTEMLVPFQRIQGFGRLKADVIKQVDENNLRAYGAAVTTSRMGVPRYWLQSDNLAIERRVAQPNIDPYSGALVPGTGQNRFFADSGGNAVYFGGVPLFYWPRISTELTDPVFYLRSIGFGNDGDFGTQIRTSWDLYQVLGIRNKPENADWIGRLDYLSERGFGFGTDFRNQTNQFLGLRGEVHTFLQSYFIRDNGTDNLGFDRRIVPLEERFRGHVLVNHRHRFQPGFTLKTEIGWISDRNFLEQYYERHWDQYKDYTTGLWLERNIYHQSFNITADFRLNQFFTETENLPKLDHFLIGHSFLFGRAVYHSHSHIGYRRFRTGDAPVNAVDLLKFDPLGWETSNANGIVAASRHEIDVPLQIGPTKVVPYIMGEAAFWQEDLNGNDTFRGFGQAGVRSSLPMWRVDPTVCSELFNVKGLAHKVTFDSEVSFGEASQDIDRFPLYDNLDDNAQEHFRRRFLFDTFGLAAGMDVPLRYDERNFAYRYGLQSYVTSPATEIVDDFFQVKFGVRNRWQTKRGMPGRERIIDWITFNINATYFPKAARDNFGADFGMLDYDFRWHIGDRLSLLSDGFYDFFGQGLRTTRLGLLTSRPGIGNAYLGLRSLEGPISSNVLQVAVSYRMSDKWALNANSTVDFADAGSIGSRLGVVFIGESFLWNVGVNYDASRGNTGFIFALEPRFLRRSRLLNLGGQAIGPASSRWLE